MHITKYTSNKSLKPFLRVNIKNFIKIKKCLICNNSNLINLGKIKNINIELNNCFNLIKCLNCFHCSLDFMPKQNFLDRLYSIDSKYVFGSSQYELFIKKNFQKDRMKSVSPNFNHWVFQAMKNFKKGNYFEIGPGGCSLFKTFKDKGYKCYAYEKKSWIVDNNIFHRINKIPKKKADLVVMTDVLEHISNPLYFLEKFNFIFKKKTRLFLSLPNQSSYKAKLLGLKWNMIVPLAHINFFSKKSMTIFLNKMNFKVIKITSYSEVKIYRLLRNFIKFLFKIPLYIFLMQFFVIKNKLYDFVINIIELVDGDQMRVIAIKK